MTADQSPRRVFSSRFVTFTERQKRLQAEMASAPFMPEEELIVLEDYLRVSRVRRDNALPIFKVQMAMLQDLVIAENVITEYKRRREDKATLDADGEETAKKKLEIIDREVAMHRAHARGLRDIADGIAWRLFGYDRAALSHIADRETSRHIEAGGLEAELRAFGEPFNDRSGVALFNDLTHFLKLGDITVKRSNDTFELIEVKTGHSTSGRITRQRQHMSEVVQILNTGERDDEGSRLVISQMATIPESFIRPVATLISAASKRGAAVDQIGDSLIVECTDFLALNEGNEEAARATIESGGERLERWRRRGDFVMPCRSRERYVFVKNFAPFSIYPLPDLVRVKLATGAMWLDSYLNLTAVLKYFEDKGWRVLKNPGEHLEELENGQETGDALATIRKGPLTTTLPGALLGRIGMEFLRPKSVVALIEEMLAAGDQSVQGVFPTFREESRLWD